MRHAARLPPPPVFDDRRLLLLIAFCKSQSIDHSFGVCVFCLRLTLAHFCRYLYVLDVCCQFASCQAMLAICKSYCKHVSDMHQNLCNNPSKYMQNPSKINQDGAKERSESGLGSKSLPGFEKTAARLRNGCHCGATWAMLGVILDPAGWQGSPKNRAFWHQVALKSQKMTS